VSFLSGYPIEERAVETLVETQEDDWILTNLSQSPIYESCAFDDSCMNLRATFPE
jgi:hypothetical protein